MGWHRITHTGTITFAGLALGRLHDRARPLSMQVYLNVYDVPGGNEQMDSVIQRLNEWGRLAGFGGRVENEWANAKGCCPNSVHLDQAH
eukprot:1157817-Pelagomonas_calceolata.AAC.10